MSKGKSAKALVDELVDAVQDFDGCYGRSGQVDPDKMKRYKQARREILVRLRRK